MLVLADVDTLMGGVSRANAVNGEVFGFDNGIGVIHGMNGVGGSWLQLPATRGRC